MKNKPLAAGVLVCALLLAQAAFGASTWEGSAVVTSTTDFPGEGLFGACNSFPLNSTVEVENLETGRKISVLITKNVDNPAIFMALSPKAALELGMKAGSSARIRVLAPSGAASTPAPTSASAAAESLDPDYNPRLLAGIRPVPTAPAGSESSRDFMSLLGAGYPGKPVEDAKPEPSAPAATPAAPPSPSPAAPVPPTPASASTTTPIEAAPKGELAPKPENPPAETPPETVPAKAVLPSFPENTVQSLPPPKTNPLDTGLASPAVLAPESSGTASLNPPATSPPPASLASPAVVNPEASSAGTPPPPSSRSLPGGELALPTLASAKALDTSPPQVSEPRSLPAAETPAVLPSLPEALAAAEAPKAVEATPVAETPTAVEPPVPEEPKLEAVLDLSPPSPVEAKAEIALADPESPPEAGAVAVLPPSLSDSSAKAPGETLGSLSLPEPALGPDLLPEAVLERLANPPKSTPSLALADSEVIMPETDKPEAIAIEGAKPGAGDKLVALVPTEPRPPEKPEALGPQASPAKVPDQPPPGLATPAGPEPMPAVALAPATTAAPPVVATPPSVATPPAMTPPVTPAAIPPATPPLASLTPAPAKAPPAKAAAAASPPAAAVAPAKAPPAVASAAVPKAPAGAPAKEPSDLVRLDGMKVGSWYVQIGLFGTEDALRQAIKAAAKQFPVLYETVVDPKGQVRYRLYVGPLGRDEGGLILTRIKGLGYKDAVLRKG